MTDLKFDQRAKCKLNVIDKLIRGSVNGSSHYNKPRFGFVC